MASNKEEALKAKQFAEKQFAVKDYEGAKNFALKAHMLFPELDEISQMVATFDIYIASEAKVSGEVDFYSVLGIKSSAELSMVKKQYKKLVVLLHPDKNKTVGADGAFKVVSEAWTLLSDVAKRACYDLKKNSRLATTLITGVKTYWGKPAAASPTFWTICTSCQVQYEYLRKYVNKRLSCKNCRATFMAMELGTAPMNGYYRICAYSHDNGYGGSLYDDVSYLPFSAMYPQCNSNAPLQWGTSDGTSDGYIDLNGYYTTAAVNTTYSANRYVGKSGKKVKAATWMNSAVVDMNANAVIKTTRPYKKRKPEYGAAFAIGDDGQTKVSLEEGIHGTKLKFCGGTSGPCTRQHQVIPTLDARSLFIKKARTGILKKLEVMKATSAAAAEKSRTRTGPITLVVPDSDFHEFDKDRTEECFQPKQIWAMYDEEDGMPRLYCLIRQVISTKPFKIHISYLSSKSDAEFGAVNRVQSGFTKSCGNFRACNTDVIDQVNMFSHLLSREKDGRGGFVRIFPGKGDVWAVYRNWSGEWNRTTPYKVRHQYVMVEVVEEYSEEQGVFVMPLIKLRGFKTVYCRNTDKNATWWIPRREMLRFSHQVPSWLLKQDNDLPEGCWDLDPAATPQELQLDAEGAEVEHEPGVVDT